MPGDTDAATSTAVTTGVLRTFPTWALIHLHGPGRAQCHGGDLSSTGQPGMWGRFQLLPTSGGFAWLDVVMGRKRRKQPLREGETAEMHGL